MRGLIPTGTGRRSYQRPDLFRHDHIHPQVGISRGSYPSGVAEPPGPERGAIVFSRGQLAAAIGRFAVSFVLLVAVLDALEVDVASVGGAALAIGLPTLLAMGYYGIVTRISGPYGIEFEFGERQVDPEAGESFEFDPQTVDVEPADIEAPMREPERWEGTEKQARATVLAFEIGEAAQYYATWMDEYIEGTTQYIVNMPRLSYVIFVDDGTFEGLMEASAFYSLFQLDARRFVERLRSVDEITELAAVVTATVPRDSTNKDALVAMEDAGTEMLAVVDGRGEFTGVITQASLGRELFVELF